MVLDGQNRLNVGIQNIGAGTIHGSRHEINLLVHAPRGDIVYHGTVPCDVLGPMQTTVFNTGIEIPAGTQLRAQVALVGMVESDTGNNTLTAPVNR